MTPDTTTVKIGQKWKQKASARVPERTIQVADIVYGDGPTGPGPTSVKIRHKETFSVVAISGFSNGKFTLVKDV